MPQNQGEMLHCALQITAPQLEQQCLGIQGEMGKMGKVGKVWGSADGRGMSLALAFFALEDTQRRRGSEQEQEDEDQEGEEQPW